MAPEPFVLSVLFGANLCFATPFGYQTNLLVMGAAGYRFIDLRACGRPVAHHHVAFVFLLAAAVFSPMTFSL
jgi:di/tricarboxylate transporter